VPELPEVETIARDLQSRIAGLTIADVFIKRSDVLREVTSRALRKELVGQRIERVWRRAKHAIIDLSGGSHICVQPRFTGALLVEDEGGPLPDDEMRYSTLNILFTNTHRLHYYDVRRLGTVTLMKPGRFEQFCETLGAEPLEKNFTSAILSALLRGSGQAVKKFIMDQSKVAGIGNIYANEALWEAGIDPSKPARDVAPSAAVALHRSIVRILSKAVESRGTSFRDYRDSSGEPGEFFASLKVYGQEGKPCARCGRRLIGTHAIDGRATVFCSNCQK
jgi:formamidopyrimidine-DNA glycosylase